MTEPKPHQVPRTTLPRRANTIRELAREMAFKRSFEEGIRQSVSDRVGYLLAFLFGAGLFTKVGWLGIAIASAVYALSVYLAYLRYRRLEQRKPKK